MKTISLCVDKTVAYVQEIEVTDAEYERLESLNHELYTLILKVIEGAKIPRLPPDINLMDFVFDSVDGWKVAAFYDGGEFDYVEHVITPKGEIFDFWDEDYWLNGCDNEYREKLINWRGV